MAIPIGFYLCRYPTSLVLQRGILHSFGASLQRRSK
jgi:hypothetical protein